MSGIKEIDVKRETLATLRELRVKMTSPEFRSLVRSSELPARQKAAQQMFAVADAYQVLLKAQIDSIRQQLKNNAPELKTTTADLKQAVNQLNDLTKTLNAISKFLGAVGKIIKLIL